jgi:hypothetical protein
MITNKGKDIIAKYLIGDASSYASYIALGCGPKPRPNINEKVGVSLAILSGSITTGTAVGDDYVATIQNMTSTLGLVPGMVLTQVNPTGAEIADNATIVSIDSPTRITIISDDPNTAGAVQFTTSGTASILSASNTDGLWIGAGVTNEQFPLEDDVIVTAINSSQNRFTITPGPTEVTFPISLKIQTDPNKQSLDFEMFRVPISSRGYVNDNGTNKIVLTAQLPSEDRYEITEVGIYSSGSNSLAGRYDSKVITAFSNNENWELVTKKEPIGEAEPVITVSPIPQYQNNLIPSENTINKTDAAIKTTTSNGLFLDPDRLSIYERPRFLSNVIMLKSDSSKIFKNMINDDSLLSLQGETNFIQINGKSIDLSKNSTSDILKVAFSIISINGGSDKVPDSVNIIVEFLNSSNTQIARLEINEEDNTLNFAENRYVVSKKRLDELVYEGSFSWRDISIIKIYASTNNRFIVNNKKVETDEETNITTATLRTAVNHNLLEGDYVSVFGVDDLSHTGLNGYHLVTSKTANTFSFSTSAEDVGGELGTTVLEGFSDSIEKDFYICLDAIRLDNVSTENPLYGLSGYSLVQNAQEKSIIKSSNTDNYLEYRFVLDVN